MQSVHTKYTAREIRQWVATLPDILAGKRTDKNKIREGFASRIAFMFLGLVLLNFNKLGRGEQGAGGETWEQLSAKYLAYSRPILGTGRPLVGKRWPGMNKKTGKQKDGFMTAAQLKKWQLDFSRMLRMLLKKHDIGTAKGIAAAIATKRYVAAGGKVKITHPNYGGRKVGSDYQILVDRSNLRTSLETGQLIQREGYDADYVPKAGSQVFRVEPGVVVVGTRDPKAAFHHYGKGRMERRFWPVNMPTDWLRRIVDITKSGLATIDKIVSGGRI